MSQISHAQAVEAANACADCKNDCGHNVCTVVRYVRSLSAPGPSRDAVKLAGDICERRGWNFDIIPALAEELTAAIGGRGEWLPIDTAPNDGLFMVLICDLPWPASSIDGRIASNAHGVVNEPNPTLRTTIEATHWMPMPPLPDAPTEPAK